MGCRNLFQKCMCKATKDFPVLGNIASLIDWGFEAEFSNIFEKFKFSSLNDLYLRFRGVFRGSFHSNFCKLGN